MLVKEIIKMQEGLTHGGWSHFDKIYCISTTGREDRRQTARLQFAQVGLGDRVEFVIVEKHPHNCELGILEAHQRCIRQALEDMAKTILIFEDDILFEAFVPKTLENVVHFMKSNDNWHLFFLGCFVSGSERTGYPSVRKIRYRCTTHAYAINGTFAGTLLGLKWSGTAYDDMLRALNDEQSYVACPAMAYQNNSETDNDKTRSVARMRRLMGGMRRLQKLNQFFHRYSYAIIALHILIIIGICGLFLMRCG